MREYLERIASLADQPNDDAEALLQHRFLIATGVVMSAGGVLWGVVATILGRHLESGIPFGYVVLTILNFVVLSRTKNFATARNFQTFISILLPFVFQWSLGGLVASGGTMLWSMLCLSAVQSFDDSAHSYRWLGFFAFLTVVSVIIEYVTPIPQEVFENAELLKGPLYLFAMNFMAVSLAIFALISIFMRLRRGMALELLKRNRQIARSQRALVQSEKLAAIGELVAGVAHELNTPLGAIRASNDNLDRAVKALAAGLPSLAEGGSRKDLDGAAAMIRRFETEVPELSTREEREARRALTRELEASGLDDARSLADDLTEIGVRELDSEVLSLLRSERWPLIFAQLRSITSLKRNSSTIKMAADRSAKIVFALKSYAHKGLSGEVSRASVAESLDKVLTLYHNQIKGGVKVVRRFDDDTDVEALHDELDQVWSNLVHNALQAMNHRGTLTLEARRWADRLTVSVEDDGAGVPEAARERLFEPFFTTKPIGEGTGLGLSISADVVRRHGGTIDVDSQPGRTVFTVDLPVKAVVETKVRTDV